MKEKTGLVLEGGGMRGLFTAGILDVFMERGLTFDGVIGVSAGAIHGSSYVTGQKGRSIRYYRCYCQDPRFISWRNFLTTGDVVGVRFCYHDIPERLDVYDYESFKNSPTAFYVVCSNVETGRPEYIRIRDMKEEMDYLRASASLPYFSRIVQVGGKKLLDGGCTDSIPLGAFKKMGYGKDVVILTRPAGYVKEAANPLLPSLYYARYPRFARALVNRHLRYNRTFAAIGELEREGKIFVIRPKQALAIGRLENDPVKIQEIYDIGRQEGQEQIDALLAWLGNGVTAPDSPAPQGT